MLVVPPFCLFMYLAGQQSVFTSVTRGLSNTVASIPTVSLVKLFLPSVSIGTDGEMNSPSVNLKSPSLNEIVSIIAMA